ncbi:hypothetical protein Tigna_02563 [Tepidimonas ignava]|uniref:Uncharacterized protein n=1 Tax=Tepidimonas ignava TaxID=114249 RepID=A0ABY3DDZ0_9BURK|nr:hypothetical protein Tigna_02563 [Tepidimonas ignava]
MVGEAQQLAHVLGRAGRAQRRHHVAHTVLGQRHDVHVAFHHQRAAGLADGLARFEQAVQLFALVEQRGFGGVEVFGLTAVQHAPAKADHLALDVADREHDAVAEAVVAARATVAVVGGHHQPALHQPFVLVVGKDGGQKAPLRRGVAQAIGFGDDAGEATAFQVLDGARAGLELGLVRARGLRQPFGQGLLLPTLGGGACARGRVVRLVGHAQPQLRSQIVHGVPKAGARVRHQKVDRVAVRAATEAVVELLGRADRERRRFFGVERAQADEVGPAFAQRHVAADDLDDVGARQQVLQKGGRDAHPAIVRHRARARAAGGVSPRQAGRAPGLRTARAASGGRSGSPAAGGSRG